LGLNGPEAQSKNVTGTRNARQPSMRDATRTLLELNGNFQPGATNVYSKFVLIHALITRIMACQKVLFNPEGTFPRLQQSLRWQWTRDASFAKRVA